MKRCLLPTISAIFFASVFSSFAETTGGLKDTTVLIIRHAEKLETGFDLAPAGFKRADAYVDYFKDFQVDGKPLKIESIFATADTKNSHRPRLTVEPLSKSLHLTPNTSFKNKAADQLADELKTKSHGKEILICWHHGQIPELIKDLGANPEILLPKGKWPEDQFAWVIELKYDTEGKLVPAECKRIEEHLMPTDPAAK
jgi:hypothetical protein